MRIPLRVLIVEDSPDDTELLCHQLRQAGFDPVYQRVASREAMIAALDRPWDIVLSDFRMPGFSGLTALELTREKVGDLPFILVSGVIGEETAVEAMKAGAHDYVMKGNLARLAPAIERELRDARVRQARRLAEQEVRDSRAFLRSTLDALAANIAILDESGVILAVNASWRRFAETNGLIWPQHGLGRNYLHICDSVSGPDAGDAKAAALGLRQVISGINQECQLEYPSHQTQEERWFAMRVTRFVSKGSYRLVVSHEDISQRRTAEVQLRKRDAELARMARLNVASELASGLAHELTQPLTTVIYGVELCKVSIQSKLSDPGDCLTDLDKISAAAIRAAKVIQRLQDFIRKREPQRSRTDINALIKETVELAGMDIRHHHVTVYTDLAKSEPFPWADPIQIQQVILNLVRNAVEAMDTPEVQDRQLIIQVLVPDSQTVEVAVRDTGHGMPEEEIEHVFTAFYTTKPEGMGIGLSISRSIIEAHGGRLWATRNPDQGMTFHFSLPAAPLPDDAARHTECVTGVSP